MIRTANRMRRDFLYRKNVESREKSKIEQKQRIKEALESSTALPGQYREGAEDMLHEMQNEDELTEKMDMDDEYSNATERDPSIMITTCRNPSSRLMKFAKELRLIFPNAERMNRGNIIVPELVDIARRYDVTDLIVCHEHQGVPDGLIISHMPYGPTAYFALENTILRHDLEDVEKLSEAYPKLIFEGFSTELGARVTNILKYLFPVPKPLSKRLMVFNNTEDYISFRHFIYKNEENEVTVAEQGPRFEMKPYKIILGTMDMAEAEVEWALRPYMNSAVNKRHL
ncbi:hypothetical protein PCE1_001173 [Barthelona sp. PCE]